MITYLQICFVANTYFHPVYQMFTCTSLSTVSVKIG